MATVKEHVAQWQHNRKFAAQIDREFVDWQVIAIFYTALHIVDAALANLNVQVSDHTKRNQEITTNAALATIKYKYMNLYRICRVTRYDADPTSWLPKKYNSVNDLVEDLLRPIENYLFALIQKSGTAPALKLDA
jgi:hypothetical protein